MLCEHQPAGMLHPPLLLFRKTSQTSRHLGLPACEDGRLSEHGREQIGRHAPPSQQPTTQQTNI